jgi:type IV secretion system protein VirB1
MLDCPDMAVPKEVMQHVVNVESSRNPFAIGVVGGYLERQPRNLADALAAVHALKDGGYNFSVGVAQVNRFNLAKYGISNYAQAFEVCPNLQAGSRILRECYDRAQDWGKAFSCYYSGNFSTGFEHGYVQKIFASMRRAQWLPDTSGAPVVNIIPYGSGSRKRARDDNLPLVAPAGQPALPVAALPAGGAGVGALAPYPEPYAIRKYLPSTPLAVMAEALARAQAVGPHAAPASQSMGAIPVPGPGAPPIDSSAGPRYGPGQIPVQIVGVDGNPYQTRVLPPSNGLPGDQLPLPNPNVFPLAPGAPDGAREARRPASGRSGPGLAARRGGSLLHDGEASGPAENSAAGPQANGAKPSNSEKSTPPDKSFVF